MNLSFSNTTPCDPMDLNEVNTDRNIMLDEIMKLKERRLKLLDQFNREHEDEIISLVKEFQDKEKRKKSPIKVKRKSFISSITPSRRSERIKSQGSERKYLDFDRDESLAAVRVFERPENDYGPMPGIEVGHHWNTRLECSHDGVHRPTVAGIHPGPEGAYSIALSGGYPEDIDEGHTVIFTGAGGRDLKGTAAKPKNLRTAPQTKDQELNGSNMSLVRSLETGKPIRVIRGYKLDSFFAPETGYRYDGLYRVVQYCYTSGHSGYRVYRFRMVRIEEQKPAPWEVPKNNIKKYFKTKDAENQNNADSDNEGELDREIKDCIEKLCQNSVKLPAFNNDTIDPNFSFQGWA